MSEAIVFGVEETPCPDPDGVGCAHDISIHSYAADGCSYIGSGGWCDCSYEPDRQGVAAILEHAVGAKYLTKAPR